MILVTGATGFLGRHIVKDLLEAGLEVRLLVRNAPERELPWKKLVEIVEGDVLDVPALEKAMQGVDKVVHAAAAVSFWRRRRREMDAVNVKGTANVVNVCLEMGVERLVHISTTGATGKEEAGKMITEQTKWLPGKHNSYYGKTKHKAEMEIHRGVAEGLHALMLNPGVIVGPGDWSKGTPKMFRVVDKGLQFYNRGLIAVVGAEDVARATRLALQADIPAGERFILVAENLSQQEFFGYIAQELGRKPPRWKLPAELTLLVGFVSECIGTMVGKEPLITLESMKSSIRRYRYDGSKIESWGFRYTPIREVIARTAAAYLAEKAQREHSYSNVSQDMHT
ncbi:MAG: NAD-dependent epimerase/dehydratase family protein [Bacteroidetes bacterium]|nr:MAG: NAD-dependent epimerase/dehydratase family protein [Bacteroidota bacterium]